jgi:multidrug resistance efflux pump
LTVNASGEAREGAPARAGAALWGALSPASPQNEFAAAWLALQCAMVPGVRCGVLVLGAPDTGPYAPAAMWPAGATPGAALTDAADQAIGERTVAVAEAEGRLAVAHPLIVDGHLHGLAALELVGQRAEMAIQALRWGLGQVEARLRSEEAGEGGVARERLMTTLNVVAATLNEERSTAAAQAIATDLATRLNCDRVSIGFRRSERSEVVAVSHSADFGERMNLIAAIAAAMDEAIDQNTTLCLPEAASSPLVTRDMAALARQHGSGSILTVPFMVEVSGREGRVLGALCLERAGVLPFTRAEIELCQGVAVLCSRILVVKRAEERSLAARLKEQWRVEMGRVLGEKHFTRKFVLMMIAAVLAISILGNGTYRVGSEARLEGAVRRVLVAPYDGYLDTAPHRAGDIVNAGTVLATFDTRDIKLEYLKAASLNEQYARQAEEALAQHDRAGAGINQAQAAQARAEMDLRADQAARASITAPFTGIVVSGDFSQSLGSAIRRGQTLFEISPLNAYRVILEIEENEIDGVHAGQHGSLVLASLPGETLPFTVTLVTPVTNAREGHSFFRVEAKLDHLGPNLRPGMEGVGKVEIGERSLFWIATHRLVNWLRITTWSWL